MYRVALFSLLVVACLARLLLLDVDPHYYQWIGYVTDEGRWSDHARVYAQLGHLTNHHGPLHLALAPLFQLASYLSFEAFGVSFVSARLPSAISGCVLLIALWGVLSRFSSRTATLSVLALIAFHADYLTLSRLGIPEMPAMAGSLLTFAALVSDVPARKRAILAGLCAGITVALKATTLPILGIFALIAFLDSRHRTMGERLAQLLWMFLPVAVGGLVAGAVTLYLGGRLLAWFGDMSVLAMFLGVRPAFDAVDLLLGGRIAPVLHFGAVGAWLAGVGFIAARPSAGDGRRRLAGAAAIWAGVYLSLILGQQYFPDRYVVHILTPFALLTAVGIDWLLDRGSTGLAQAAAHSFWSLAWIALPTGILAAPILVGLAQAFGVDPRTRVLLAAIAACWTGATLGLHACRNRPGAVHAAVALPIVGAILWFAGWAVFDARFVFWPSADSGGSVWTAVWRMALAAAASTLIAVWKLPGRVAALAAAGSVAGLWLVHLAPGFIEPHHTMQEISRDLGERFGAYEVVEYNAESLFLDNAVPFRWLYKELDDSPPEYLVVALQFDRSREWLREHYEPIAHYDLYVSDRFKSLDPDYWRDHCFTPDGHNVTIYRRRSQLPAR